jgi:osmotically-inducible protein OsmY
LTGRFVTLSRATAALRRSVPATAAIVLSLWMVSGTLAPRRIETVASKTTAPRAPAALGDEPWGGGQRAADRVIERRVRGAIRADPFLALAAPRVKVTIRRGVVRLVGRVRTAKERSSIAFKAGQNARAGRVDNRVTIGDGVKEAAW